MTAKTDLLLERQYLSLDDLLPSSGQKEASSECTVSASVQRQPPVATLSSLIVFEPEEVETEAFFASKSMEFSKDWFIWVLGEKNMFSQFLSYIKVRRRLYCCFHKCPRQTKNNNRRIQ
jgi:hypothetical protein